MAVNDLLSKLSNLELGNDNGETERSSTFWNPALLSMKSNLEPAWLHATWNAKTKPNFGMRNMDAILEERCSLGDIWAFRQLFEGNWKGILG